MPLSSASTIEERLQNGNNLLHTCTDLAEAQKLVLESNIDVNALNNDGKAPIHALMRLGNPGTIQVIHYLLGLNELRPNVQEPDGTTAAHLCEWGTLMSDLVIRKDFDPNIVRSCDGNTPLMYCITYNKHLDVIRRLLEDARIDFEVRNSVTNKTAVEIATTAIADLQCVQEETADNAIKIRNIKQMLEMIQQKIAARQRGQQSHIPASNPTGIFPGYNTATELPSVEATPAPKSRWSKCGCVIS